MDAGRHLCGPSIFGVSVVLFVETLGKAPHEERLRALELAASRDREEQRADREPTAAEALRTNPKFRHAVHLQIAGLIDDLARLPPHVARKILSDDDVDLLEAVINEGFK